MAAYYNRPVRLSLLGCSALLIACSDARQPPSVTVYAAASMARPLKTLADSFQRRTNTPVLAELGGSLEHARKITDLGRVPDVLMLVDDTVVAALMPAHLDWYVRFATNRVVVAYSPRSRHADSIGAGNWWRVLARPDVTVGRADPAVAPAGVHALRLMRRAEVFYAQPGLADRLLARATLRYMRPNATELAALLEAGEVDYIMDYQSVAHQYGFRFVALPDEVATPVLYGLAVPRFARNAEHGVKLAAFILSPEGLRILGDAKISTLPVPVAIGADIPDEIRPFVRKFSPGTTR